MKASSSLHELIHTLSQVEKAYFRKYTSRFSKDRQSNYMELFELILKQAVYDENELRMVLEARGRNYVKRLAAEKQYLYDTLLNCLRQYDRSRQRKDDLCIRLVQEADLLFSRRLIRQARNRLNRAKRIAIANDLYVAHRYLLERELKFELFERQKATKKSERIYEEISEIHDNLENANRYRKLNHEIEVMTTAGNNRRYAKLMDALTEKMELPLLSDIQQANCYVSRMYFYSLRQEYAQMKDDQQGCYENSLRVYQLILDRPDRHSPYSKVYAMMKLAKPLLALKREEEAMDYLAQAHAITKVSPHMNTLYLGQFLPMLFNHHWHRDDRKKMEHTFKRYYAQLEEVGLENEPEELYRMHLCHVKYELRYGSLRKALEWLNPLLFIKRDALRDSTFLEIKLYELIIHTELGHTDLVISRKLSLEHWLKENHHWKKCWIYQFIKGLGAHLNQSISGESTKPIALSYKEEEQSFLGLSVMKEFDFWSWLQGKVESLDQNVMVS